MPKHSFTIGENRTIFVTLDELNAQRAKAGASPVVATSSRTIANDANAYNASHAQAIQSAQPFAQYGGVNPDALKVQELVKTNFDPSTATPQQAIDQNRGMAFATPQYVDPSTIKTTTPVSSGQTVYKNAASGLQSGVTNTIKDGQQVSSPVSLVGKDSFQQGAIDRMREKGMTDEQIRTQLNAVAPQLQSTMSNTGLGGTFDQNGMFVPSKLTDKQRIEKAGQDAVDNALSWARMPNGQIDPAISRNPAEEEQVRQAAMASAAQIIASEAQKNAALTMPFSSASTGTTPPTPPKIPSIPSQNQPQGASGAGTTQGEPTPTKTPTTPSNPLEGADPLMQAAFQGVFDALSRGDTASAQMATQQIQALLSDTSVAESANKSREALTAYYNKITGYVDQAHQIALDREAQVKKDQENQLASAKAKFELDQAKVENDQRQANIEAEKRNRRAAASLGITFDTNGINFLSEQVRKGNETLSYLAESGNIQRASFADTALRIAEAYKLDTREADLNYEQRNAELLHSYEENLSAIQKSVSLDAKDKKDKVASILKEFFKQRNENDLKRAEYQKEINVKTLEMKDKALTQLSQDERLDKRLAFQEQQANNRMMMQLNNQDRQQMNIDKRNEMASADDIRSQVRSALNSSDVQNYAELRSARDRMKEVLSSAIGSNDPNKLGAAKQLVLTLVAKASDPTTGVREGELTKFGKNQTWLQSVEQVGNAIAGGDMTGVSMKAIEAYVEAIDLMSQAQKSRALSQLSPTIGAIISHNNRSQYFPLNPSDILPMDYLQDATEAFNSYTNAESKTGDVYNFQWNDGGKNLQSSTNVPKKSGEDSYGLFQINMDPAYAEKRMKNLGLKSKEDLYDPVTNAKAAYAISSGGTNWTPWTTYTSGKYKPYLGFDAKGKLDNAGKESLIYNIKNAGFTGKNVEIAFAIALAESGGRAKARYNPNPINTTS